MVTADPHNRAMNLRTFLLIDSVLLDIAAVVALIAGAAAPIAIALFALAAVTFVAFAVTGTKARRVGVPV